MRAVWLMPMAYVAGVHGFAFFMPYLLLVGLLAGVMESVKRRPPPLAAPVVSELEPASV